METSKCRLNSDKASTSWRKGAEAWKELFGSTFGETALDEYIKEVNIHLQVNLIYFKI